MARDAAATRDRLVEAGQRLFAAHGIHATPLKQIVDAAGQKNASALHYHFGGREGLLQAIIERHNAGIEATRAPMLDQLERTGRLDDLRGIVEAFVLPQADQLETESGREFLVIVAQLVDVFDLWDTPASPPQARRALLALRDALPEGLSPALRHERVTRFMELVSEALGTRARLLGRGRGGSITNEAFVRNLIDMAVGALGAPTT